MDCDCDCDAVTGTGDDNIGCGGGANRKLRALGLRFGIEILLCCVVDACWLIGFWDDSQDV